MGFEVYDFREVNRNVLVTPEIRARLYHMKPGQVDARHSHDLGHEIFLILEGLAEFNINGEVKRLGPGEMCVALADEIHQVRNLLQDKPTIMYLSVTPHVQPTHTHRTECDEKEPPRFSPNTTYHVDAEKRVTLASLLDAQVQAAQMVLETAQRNLETQRAQVEAIAMAKEAGDQEAAIAARNAMWESVYALHKQLYAFDALWNESSPRIAHEVT